MPKKTEKVVTKSGKDGKKELVKSMVKVERYKLNEKDKKVGKREFAIAIVKE